jgi:hypothetical protein
MAADAASDYLENAVLKHFLGISSVTSPSSTYVALFTSDPTDANSGTEVSGGSYARQPASWTTPTAGTAATTADIVYQDMPAATVTHWGLYDSLTGGHLLFHSPFDVSKAPAAGDTLTIPSGGLTISES